MVNNICDDLSNSIIHVTHNDLDAIGCNLIADMVAMNRGMGFRYYFTNVSSTSKRMYEIMDEINSSEHPTYPKMIILSDISVNDTCAERLNNFCKDNHIELVHLDHHMTDTLDEKYEWSTVNRQVPQISAAQMMFDYFHEDVSNAWRFSIFNTSYNNESNKFDFLKRIAYLINDISRYDTWRWKHEWIDGHEEYYSILSKFYGVDKYYLHLRKMVFTDVNTDDMNNFFDNLDCAIIENLISRRENEIDAFVKDKDRIYKKQVDGITIGYIMSNTEFSNQIMEAVYLENPDIDMVCNFFPSTRNISLRSNKPNVDCGKFATQYGGGGHKSSAGAAFIDIDVYTSMLNEYYHAINDQKRFRRRNK